MNGKQGGDGWDFCFTRLRRNSLCWNVASALIVSSVGLLSKLYISVLNQCNLINVDKFEKLLDNRPKHVPLLTFSNHISCFDDPGLWGALKVSVLTSAHKMRWSLAAQDICYTNKLHGYFFLLGKSIPIVRGNGVYQAAMDFCVERLEKGDWVHIFPEGRVNMSQDFSRLKWGFGRLIYDPRITPIIVPIWHIGMDRALPNKEPYILTSNNQLTFNFGEPIHLNNLVDNLKKNQVLLQIANKVISDKLQSQLIQLKIQTQIKHNLHYGFGLDRG